MRRHWPWLKSRDLAFSLPIRGSILGIWLLPYRALGAGTEQEAVPGQMATRPVFVKSGLAADKFFVRRHMKLAVASSLLKRPALGAGTEPAQMAVDKVATEELGQNEEELVRP